MAGSTLSKNQYVPDEVGIDELPHKVVVDGANDYIITYDASASTHKKVKLSNLNQGNYTRLVKTSADDTTTSSTVWSDVSDLSYTLPTNKTFLCLYYLLMQSTDSTVGAHVSLNLGTTHTLVGGHVKRTHTSVTAGVTHLTGDQTTSGSPTSMVAANTPILYIVEAIVRSGASSGALVPSFRSETGSSATITAKKYSWGEVIQLD